MKFKFIKSKDFDFIRSLIKNWDEFREDSNLLLLNYPQIKEKEFWVLGHFDVRDKYFAHLYKLQNGKYFEEFEPLEDRGDGYINNEIFEYWLQGEKMTKKANKKELIYYISILLLIFCAVSLLFDIYMAFGVVYGLISATIFNYILKKKLDKQ